MTCAVAGLVLGIFFVARLYSGHWGPKVVPVGALMVVLSGPSDLAANTVQRTPIGLLAVVGSFALFGLGTILAFKLVSSLERSNLTDLDLPRYFFDQSAVR